MRLSVIPGERQGSMDISRALGELLGAAGPEQGWLPVAPQPHCSSRAWVASLDRLCTFAGWEDGKEELGFVQVVPKPCYCSMIPWLELTSS